MCVSGLILWAFVFLVSPSIQAQSIYIKSLEKGLERAVFNDDYKKQKDILHELAVYYYEAEEYRKAYENNLLYANAADSVFSHGRSIEIGKLEAKFEKELELEEEQLRKEKEAWNEMRIEKRRNNLQYSGILIFLVVLVISLFMSGKFKLSVRAAGGLIFFTFLLLFEFLLVLLDPFTESISGGAPAIKLSINAVLAGVIFPLHRFFEKTLKKRIFSN